MSVRWACKERLRRPEKGAQRRLKNRRWEEREVVMFVIVGCSCHCERILVEHDDADRSGGADLGADMAG